LASNLVVVEGALDALALDTYAASAGVDLTAASPSGVVLTAAHRASIYTQAASPPVLCADGDPARRKATAKWILEMTLEGREAVAVILPHPYDPAEWLAERAIPGLPAFIRSGCLDASPSDVRPRHAGRYLAEKIAATSRQGQIGDILAALGALGVRTGRPCRTKAFRRAGR
jgi:Toprim-like